jgi:hypothetical protein
LCLRRCSVTTTLPAIIPDQLALTKDKDKDKNKGKPTMKLYKLTDQAGRTRNGTQWGDNVTHRATGAANQDLCTDGWIHAYEHPLIACLLNPIHADIAKPRLWEARGRVGKRDGQLKCGCRTLTTVAELALPEISTAQCVRFAIACAWPRAAAEWRIWARGWLNNSDRTAAAAEAAEAAARAAEAAAAEVAARAAAEAAAEVAARAAAAEVAAEAAAAVAAAWAVAAAEAAARAAAAAWAVAALNIIACAEWAMTDKPIEAIYPNAT